MGKRLMSGKDAKSKGKKFSHGSNRGDPGVVKWDEEKHKWIYVGKKVADDILQKLWSRITLW